MTWVEAAEPPKTPPPAGDAKQASPVPVAIANSEIIPRAEQTVKQLQKIKIEVSADSALKSIQTDFAAFAEKSDRRRESEVEIMSKSRSAQRLNEILREWNLEQRQLEDWDQALARRSEILAVQEKDIDRIIETWRATQVAVEKKFLFKAVLRQRVEEILREAQATRLAIEEQTTKLLKLQSQVVDRLATLAKIRKEIDQAREEFCRGLFALDSPRAISPRGAGHYHGRGFKRRPKDARRFAGIPAKVQRANTVAPGLFSGAGCGFLLSPPRSDSGGRPTARGRFRDICS